MDKAVDVRPRWGRWIGIAFGILVLLLVIIYFVATSAAFLKGVILPRAGKSLNAQITVDDASISPFSQVVLKNFRLKTTGTEPLVSANEVRLRYSLMDIIRGHINVDEATLDTPTISIVKEADGSSNLDPLLKGEKKKEEKKPGNKKTNLDVKNVALKNGTVRITQKLKNGGPNTTELTGLNVALDQLKTGGSGKLTIASDLQMHNRPATNSNDVLAAKINGAYDFAISPELAPQSIKGSTKIQVSQAQGAFKDAAGLVASLDADANPNNINQIGFRFEKDGKPLGQLRVHGPFDLAKTEGTLTLELLSFDRNILNIAGASSGMDFGNSTIDSTNRIDITKKATAVAIDGKLTGKQLGVVRDQKPTPPVDLDFDYKLAADLNARTAGLDRVRLSARHKDAEFLSAKIDQPMKLSWGGSTPEIKESAFRLVVTNLNLADWQAMLGTNPPSGVVNAGFVALAQNNGKKLALDINALIDRFGMTLGSNAVRNAQIAFNGKGSVEDLKRVDLPEFGLTIRSNNAPTLTAKGSAKYDVNKKSYDAQLTADSSLPNLFAQFPVASIQSSSGAFKLTVKATGSPSDTHVTGTAEIDKLTGKIANMPLQDYHTKIDYDVGLKGDAAEISRLAIALDQGANKGGTIEVNGRVDTKSKVGKVAFKVADLNQFALTPALQNSLGEKRLVSVLMNGSVNANFAPGTNDITTDLTVTNLVVKDPAGSLPTNALGMGVNLDASMRGQSVDVRKMSLRLSPTKLAENRLDIQATLDTSSNNPAPGNVSIKSPGLDLTPYYDIFAGNKKAAPPGKAPTEQATTTASNNSTNANAEPAAMNLPVKQLTATVAIDKLFLRQIAISNWNASAVISNNNLTLSPLKLAINGAPVKGDVALNLGVPGYEYNLALTADRVPLEPFANSFVTNQAGNYKGFLVADAKIRGAGITGASLQKSLQGNANFSITNMDLKIGNRSWWRGLLLPISLVLNAPELTETPVDFIDAQLEFGSGKISVKKTDIQSEAFFAHVAGDIPIDKVLTNSPLNLPLDISLRRSLAAKVNLLPDNTPADAKYAALPRFVTIKGTLGDPKSDANKLALGGLLAKGVSKYIPGRAGNVLNEIGGVTTGGGGTNSSTGANLIQGLGGLLGGNKANPTNAPGTNAPSTKAAAPNLFDLLKKK
jgi:uncharacterized protein involved in outer membrane biogenesis